MHRLDEDVSFSRILGHADYAEIGKNMKAADQCALQRNDVINGKSDVPLAPSQPLLSRHFRGLLIDQLHGLTICPLWSSLAKTVKIAYLNRFLF